MSQSSGWRDPRLQLALSVLCVLFSELLLKRGASETASATPWSWTGLNSLVSPLVWWGILFVVASGTGLLKIGVHLLCIAFIIHPAFMLRALCIVFISTLPLCTYFARRSLRQKLLSG